jgi:hypothetical protein
MWWYQSIGLPLTLNCGYLYLNLKGHHPLNSIKLVSAFKNHKISFDETK